jgi:phospholipid/cholesterol/gamma-HCH transport system substrate-binding protein
MDENRLKFGVGVLVISSIGIGIILTFLFGAFPSVFNNDYNLSVVFPSAEGVGLNTKVVRDGVAIGRVSDIELRDEGGVLITLTMDSEFPISHRYVPRIGSGNFVTGDAKIEFIPASQTQLARIYKDDQQRAAELYTPDEFFNYGSKSESLFEMQNELTDTFDAIKEAGESIAMAGESVDQLAKEMRNVVGGTNGRIDQVSQGAVKALEEFQSVMQGVREIVENPQIKAGLESSAEELPKLLANAQRALSETEGTLESINRAGKQFERVGVAAEETVLSAKSAVEQTEKSLGNTVKNAEKTFANLAEFTQPFAEQGDDFAAQVLTTLAGLDRTLTQVETFGRTLNNSEGTVKRLLEDEELYYQLRRTVENIEAASARVRPILDDVRIFSDKIARDPRQLGIRGAISKRPGGAGLK